MRRFGLMGVALGSLLVLSACSGESPEKEPAPTAPAASAAAPAADARAAAPTGEMAAPSAAPAAAGATVTLAGLTGDVARGQRVFMQCRTCHAVEAGVNKVGPSLHGIIGRQSGTIPNFNYSAANKASGVTWSEDVLFTYLENPRKFMPGTRMSFVGLRDAQQRADVIAYLKTQS